MPTTSFYFNNQNFTLEQRLLQDLTTEMIRINGVDVIYLPRSTPNIDKIFLEDPTSEFLSSVHIEMYIKDFAGWRGQGDMMTKFGIQMADQITFCLSRRRFDEEIGSTYDMIRPREGDLIYFGVTNSIFEIKFVEHEATFYQTGSLQFYELRCERWNYSNESIETGVEEIDNIEDKYSFSSHGHRLLLENGDYLVLENGGRILMEDYVPDLIDASAQNQLFEDKADDINISVTNPFV